MSSEMPVSHRGPGEPRPPAFGSFRYLIAEGRWEWSPEVAAMHGYADGEVVPTTELVLRHKHPEDRERVEGIVAEMTRGHAFSSRHRIVTTTGAVRQVLVVADTLHDPTGEVIGTEGFYVDLTETHDAELKNDLDAAVEDFARSRAVIEQAKGILMFTYGVNAQRAFEVLTWRSQNINVKVRVLAENFVTAASAAPYVEESTRQRIDRLILTAHMLTEQTDEAS